MKKSAILVFLMLILTSNISNAISFKKLAGERYFYLPELSVEMNGMVFEYHNYKLDYPIDAHDALNSAIIKQLFLVYTDPIDYEGSSILDAAEVFLNTFMDKENAETAIEIKESEIENFYMPMPQNIFVSGTVKKHTPNIIIYECETGIYAAMAPHPYSHFSYINFYIPQQKVLTISDLLLTSKKSTINKAVRRNARKVIDQLYTNDTSDIEYSEIFYLSNKGITFVYQAYEIGPGASGVIEITVPKSALTGCLTKLGELLIN